MLFETNKDKGRAGMALAIAYFGANGYTVNIPLNDTQWYDLIVEKEGRFYTVQCKATGTKNNTIELRNCGGTNGKAYDNVLNHNIDYLFCLDNNQHMYLIPINDIKEAGNTKSFRLNSEHSPHNNGFQSYKYLVQI